MSARFWVLVTYTCAVGDERNSSRTHSLSELVKSNHGRLPRAAWQCRNRETTTYLCRKSQTACNMVQTAARSSTLATPCTSCFVVGPGRRSQRRSELSSHRRSRGQHRAKGPGLALLAGPIEGGSRGLSTLLQCWRSCQRRGSRMRAC